MQSYLLSVHALHICLLISFAGALLPGGPNFVNRLDERTAL